MPAENVLPKFSEPAGLQIDYAGELNQQQHAAVTAPPGPALVIAGAGSGKTRTLTYRVAYLLEQGVPADRILLLTFTNKAAGEMMRRVVELLGQELRSLWGGTFHSIGHRILRRHADLLGYQRDFTILDREDARHLIADCLKESGIAATADHFPKPEVLGDIFSLCVNTEKSIAQVLEEQYDYFGLIAPQVQDVQQRYTIRKRAGNELDFDDLLALWLKLLQEHPQAQEQYQRRFQFILVDEYQDTNKLQSDLIDLLAARHRNVMVVGDDAQSIYSWRGADCQNLLRFPKRYPETKIYKIETNYRSTPEILTVANAAINANTHGFNKELSTERRSGTKPTLVVCQDSFEQAAFVAKRSLELREAGTDLNKMAVLYRSHFHAMELQLELTRRNIPFSITSGIRFFEQAHIKDVAAYLKLVTNPRDELSFKRLAQLLPGIGDKGADKLWKAFRTDGREERGERREAKEEGPIAAALARCADSVPKKTKSAWEQFVATFAQIEEAGVRGNASRMIGLILEATYEDYLQETYANYRSRLEEVEQLAVYGRQFSAIEDFLAELALQTSVEAQEERPARADDERLRLSTVHQAKGLEFDVVFVIMMCDGLFPSARSLKIREDEEEERRLMYVAITRARNELYLSYPLIRATPGGGGNSRQNPSRFLKEIPRKLINEWSPGR